MKSFSSIEIGIVGLVIVQRHPPKNAGTQRESPAPNDLLVQFVPSPGNAVALQMDTTNPTVHAVHRDVVILARENARPASVKVSFAPLNWWLFSFPVKGAA